MASLSARIALFQNESDNPDAPTLTGRLEISVDQLDALIEALMDQPEFSYGTRRYKVLDLSAWEADGSSALAYSGKARLPRPKTAKAPQPAAPKAHFDTVDELLEGAGI